MEFYTMKSSNQKTIYINEKSFEDFISLIFESNKTVKLIEHKISLKNQNIEIKVKVKISNKDNIEEVTKSIIQDMEDVTKFLTSSSPKNVTVIFDGWF